MSQLSPELFNQAKTFLSSEQKALVSNIEVILKRIQPNDNINDYSFSVAPIAKAYEGYLKDFFLKLGIINDNDHDSDRFRVGKTLNPSLRYKRFSVFQKLTEHHDNGEELAEILWTAWKYGRNEILHYFPGSLKNLSRSEAEDRICMVLEAIIKAGEFLESSEYIKSQPRTYSNYENQ